MTNVSRHKLQVGAANSGLTVASVSGAGCLSDM